MLLAVISGALAALAFPPFDQPLVVWFALVPLLVSLMRCDSVRRAVILGAVAGLVFGLMVLEPLRSAHLWTGWAAIPLESLEAAQTRNARFLTVLWLVASLWMTVFWGAFAASVRYMVATSRVVFVVAAPCLWVLVPEFARCLASGGFHWALMGNAAAAVPQVRQLAALGGVWLLSGFVVLVNAAIAGCIASQKKRGSWLACAVVFVLLGGSFGWGQWRLLSKTPKQPLLGVVALQHGETASAPKESLATGLEPSLLAAVDTTVRRLDGRFRLLVLPESVTLGALSLDTTVAPDRPTELQHRADNWESVFGRVLGGRDIGVILGTDTVERGRVHNSMVAFGPRGITGWYHKRRLVPFAEATPKLWPGGTRGRLQYSRGGDQQPISVGELDLGSLICQEVLFPSLTRESVRGGATILISGGNDGVFASRAVAEVNARAAQMRATESGRYLVRAMKTGVTAVIDPTGSEIARSTSSEPTVLLAKVEPLSDLTPYVRFGNWVVIVAAAFSIGLWLITHRETDFAGQHNNRTDSS
jgi:apolipoprotein N-acyltransferase